MNLIVNKLSLKNRYKVAYFDLILKKMKCLKDFKHDMLFKDLSLLESFSQKNNSHLEDFLMLSKKVITSFIVNNKLSHFRVIIFSLLGRGILR